MDAPSKQGSKLSIIAWGLLASLASFHESDVPGSLYSPQCRLDLYIMQVTLLACPHIFLFPCLELCPWKRWWRGNHHAAELRQNCRRGKACSGSFSWSMCLHQFVQNGGSKTVSTWSFSMLQRKLHLCSPNTLVKTTSMRSVSINFLIKTRARCTPVGCIWFSTYQMDGWRETAGGQ